MKGFRIAFWMFFAAGFLAGCGGKTGEAKLVVGMELSYPPFEMKDETGTPLGVSVDLARALGEHLGRAVEIRDMAWVGLIPALQSGRIDCVISSMTITEERDRAVDFSDPYVSNGICLLARKDGRVKSAKDLVPGVKLAVKLGTTGHLYAQEFLGGVELSVLEDAGLCALEVAQGRADAFLYDQVSIYQYSTKHPDTTVALLQSLRAEQWGIAVVEGNAALLEEINAFLAQYRAEGGFDALGSKWLAEWKVSFEEMGVSFVF